MIRVDGWEDSGAALLERDGALSVLQAAFGELEIHRILWLILVSGTWEASSLLRKA